MIASILISFEVTFQEIGEKENFKDKKHDKQFNQNNQPNLFAPMRKIYESFLI